eukprot:1950069-Amphidinium_carterae.1
MKVPIAPSEEEKRHHNLTHYPYKERSRPTYAELEYTSDSIELKRFEWDGRKTAFGTARHVQDDQVMRLMPRRTVWNEDTDTSSVSTMAVQTRLV